MHWARVDSPADSPGRHLHVVRREWVVGQVGESLVRCSQDARRGVTLRHREIMASADEWHPGIVGGRRDTWVEHPNGEPPMTYDTRPGVPYGAQPTPTPVTRRPPRNPYGGTPRPRESRRPG